jgi:autotransporter passenger strand-loop-strand repeat protein
MATVFDGVEFIMSGDVVSGLVFADAGIYDAAVGSGGLLISAVVSGFGQVDISSGGEAIGTFIYGNEAFEYVASGGLTIGAQVATSGQEEVASGAVSSDAQIIGGTEIVYGGALAFDTTVSAGKQEVGVGGVASGTVAVSGGTETVYGMGGGWKYCRRESRRSVPAARPPGSRS